MMKLREALVGQRVLLVREGLIVTVIGHHGHWAALRTADNRKTHRHGQMAVELLPTMADEK